MLLQVANYWQSSLSSFNTHYLIYLVRSISTQQNKMNSQPPQQQQIIQQVPVTPRGGHIRFANPPIDQVPAIGNAVQSQSKPTIKLVPGKAMTGDNSLVKSKNEFKLQPNIPLIRQEQHADSKKKQILLIPPPDVQQPIGYALTERMPITNALTPHPNRQAIKILSPQVDVLSQLNQQTKQTPLRFVPSQHVQTSITYPQEGAKPNNQIDPVRQVQTLPSTQPTSPTNSRQSEQRNNHIREQTYFGPLLCSICKLAPQGGSDNLLPRLCTCNKQFHLHCFYNEILKKPVTPFKCPGCNKKIPMKQIEKLDQTKKCVNVLIFRQLAQLSRQSGMMVCTCKGHMFYFDPTLDLKHCCPNCRREHSICLPCKEVFKKGEACEKCGSR